MYNGLKKLLKNPMLAILALAAILYGGTKQGATGRITFDELLTDNGSHLTNDVCHIEAVKTSLLLPDTAEMLVHAREIGATNVLDWIELTPRRTVGDLPCDYVLLNATNYNVNVTVDWQPSQTVVTNLLLTVHGRETMKMPVSGRLDAVLLDTTGRMGNDATGQD